MENINEIKLPKIKKANGDKFSILIVDDSMFQRNHISKLIAKMDCQIAGHAEDGIDGYTLYKELNPDLVTMDITMPGMNGYESLKNIIEYNPAALVVMVTALTHDAMIQQCLDAGAKDYITKPFKPSETAFKIIKILRKNFELVFED